MASEGIVVETTIEDAAVQAMLSHAIARSIDLEPAFVLIGKRLAASTFSRAEKQIAPDGTPWAPLSDSTVKAHERASTPNPHKALFGATGRMLRMTHANASATELKFGTNVKSKGGFLYPWIQQVGSTRIPARPWLGISDADEVAIGEILKHYIEGT